MVTFLDGPAKGQTMLLRRAPVFLRVVRNSKGTFDALDQPDDTPEADETIVAYRRQGDASPVHFYARKGGSGWYEFAKYAIEPDQPSDATMRDRAAWKIWATQRYKSNPSGNPEPEANP